MKTKTKLKKGRYYISMENDMFNQAGVVYYCQYVDLNGVPCGWRYSYQRHPVLNYYGWITFDLPNFGYDGYRINEEKLRLISKDDEKGITCFDTATRPDNLYLLSFTKKTKRKSVKLNSLVTKNTKRI